MPSVNDKLVLLLVTEQVRTRVEHGISLLAYPEIPADVKRSKCIFYNDRFFFWPEKCISFISSVDNITLPSSILTALVYIVSFLYLDRAAFKSCVSYCSFSFLPISEKTTFYKPTLNFQKVFSFFQSLLDLFFACWPQFRLIPTWITLKNHLYGSSL